MISSVVALIRTNRANGIKTSTRAQLAIIADGASVSETPNSMIKPEITLTNGQTTVSINSENPSHDGPPPSPLSTSDFSSLFEISPHLLVQPHLGAVERLYAIPVASDSESSDTGSSEDDAPLSRPSTGGKSARRTVSRSVSRSGRSPSNVSTTGRDQYLIDPSAVVIPLGHPDVAHPRLASLSLPTPTNGQHEPSRSASLSHHSSSSRRGTLQGGAGGGGGGGQMSPKALSLRHQLFPELEPDAAGIVDSPLPLPQSPGPDSSTDAASDSDDGVLALSVGKAKGKAGPPGPKKAGRKLWEVVDSVRLLDGVLS